MVKSTLALACVLCAGVISPVAAKNDRLVRFDGGIGVIPVSHVTVNADGSVTPSTGVPLEPYPEARGRR